MIPPTEHPREEECLHAVRRSGILDTPAEPEFDDIAKLAAAICGTPIAIIDFIDRDRLWLKSQVGMDLTETPRDTSFCAHASITMMRAKPVKQSARCSMRSPC